MQERRPTPHARPTSHQRDQITISFRGDHCITLDVVGRKSTLRLRIPKRTLRTRKARCLWLQLHYYGAAHKLWRTRSCNSVGWFKPTVSSMACFPLFLRPSGFPHVGPNFSSKIVGPSILVKKRKGNVYKVPRKSVLELLKSQDHVPVAE